MVLYRSRVLAAVFACAVALTLATATPAAANPAGQLLDAGPGPVWDVVAAVLRWLVYLAVLIAAGAAFFLAYLHRGPAGERRVIARAIVMAAMAGVAVTVLRIPVQAVHLSNVEALADLGAWEAVLESRFGLSALVTGGGLVLMLVALAQRGTGPARHVAVAGGVIAVGGFVLTGHSITGEPLWVSVGSMFAHNVAAAVWAGGLVAVGVLLPSAVREPGPELAATVGRFSTAATGSVAAVALAGAASAWVQVGAWSALWGSDYGRLLMLKIALVAGVVAAGGYNRQRLVPAMRRDPADAWKRLRRVVRIEAVGIAAVVAVTAVLVNVTPARAGGEIFAEYADLDAETRVQLVVDPNQVGTNEAHIYLVDGVSRPTDVADEVEVRFTPDGAAAPVTVVPSRAGPGHYLHVGDELDEAGSWRIEVVVDLDSGERETATFDIVPGRGGATAATATEGGAP